MRFLRTLGALAAMGSFALISVVLLWSDRAGAIPSIGGRLVLRLGRRAEADLGLDLFDRSDVPFAFDQLGHAALWFAGMMLFGWVGRRLVPLWLTAVLVGGASVLSEAGQGWASTTRDVSAGDAAANLIGVGAGFIILTIVFSFQFVAAKVGVDRRPLSD